MMRHVVAGLFVACLVCGLQGLHADGEVKGENLKGTVVQTAGTDLVFLEDNQKASRKFPVLKTATITFDGKATRLADLKAGARVQVTVAPDKATKTFEAVTKIVGPVD